MSGDLRSINSFALPLAILGFLASVIKGSFAGSFGAALISGLISALAMGLLGVGVFFILKTIMPELFQGPTINNESTIQSPVPAATNASSSAQADLSNVPTVSSGNSTQDSLEEMSSNSSSEASSKESSHAENTKAAVQKRSALSLGTGEIDVEGIPITDDRAKMAQVVQHLIDQDSE